jgi:hypothetical protein
MKKMEFEVSRFKINSDDHPFAVVLIANGSSVRLLSTRKMQQNTNEAQTQAQTEERHVDR